MHISNEHYNLKNQTSHKNQSVLKGWHSEDKISSFTFSRKVLVAESAGACHCITTNWLVAEPWLDEYGRKYMLIIIVFQIFEFKNPASIVALPARPIISLTCCFYHNQVLCRCFSRKNFFNSCAFMILRCFLFAATISLSLKSKSMKTYFMSQPSVWMSVIPTITSYQ